MIKEKAEGHKQPVSEAAIAPAAFREEQLGRKRDTFICVQGDEPPGNQNQFKKVGNTKKINNIAGQKQAGKLGPLNVEGDADGGLSYTDGELVLQALLS